MPISIKIIPVSFFKFCLVGSLNFLITITVFHFAFKLTENYNLASILGFLLSLINSYLLNKNFTFSDRRSKKNTKIKFFTANLLGLVINILVLNTCISLFGINETISQCVSIIAVMFVNYTTFKIIFR